MARGTGIAMGGGERGARARRWQQPTLGHILTPARYQLLLVVQIQKQSKKKKAKMGIKPVEAPKTFVFHYIIYIYIHIYLGVYFYLLAWAQACQPGPELCQSCGARKMSRNSERMVPGKGVGGGKLHKTNAVNLQHAASLGSAH